MGIERQTKAEGNAGRGLSVRRIAFYWLPLFAYMTLIFYMSSQPMKELPLPKNTDKIIHFIEYGILGIFWFRALKTIDVNSKQTMFAAFIMAFLYGISDEIHQYFVPERDASVFDAVADGLGGWVGIWSYIKATGGKYAS